MRPRTSGVSSTDCSYRRGLFDLPAQRTLRDAAHLRDFRDIQVRFHRRKRTQHVCCGFQEIQALRQIGPAVFAVDETDLEIDVRLCRLVQQRAEFIGAVFFDVFVRVFAVVYVHDPYIEPCRAQHVAAADGSLDAGCVGIQTQNGLLRIALQQLRLFWRKSRSKRRAYVAHTALIETNDIHVSFDQDGVALFLDLGLRQVEPVQIALLFEDEGLLRVEVFGGVTDDGTASEPDHFPHRVEDGKHYPAPEFIVQPAVLRGSGTQAQLRKELRLRPLGKHIVAEGLPALVRVADAELRYGLRLYAAAFHVIIAGIGMLRKSVEEKTGRRLIDGVITVFFLALALVGIVDLDAVLGGQPPHGFGKIQIVIFLYEFDDVSGFAATETGKDLFLLGNDEGRRLFLVEGTAALIVASGSLYGDQRTYNVYDVAPAADLFCCRDQRCDCHTSPPVICLQENSVSSFFFCPSYFGSLQPEGTNFSLYMLMA